MLEPLGLLLMMTGYTEALRPHLCVRVSVLDTWRQRSLKMD